MAEKFTEEYAYSIYRENGFEPLERYVNCKEKIKCLNSDGYYINIDLDNVKLGKKGRPFSTYNKYSDDNIKLFIDKDTNGEYEYVSGHYVNNKSFITIRHKRCGKEFSAKWINLNRHPSEKDVNRRGTRCPFCEAKQLESTHALVLKQVWLHEKSNTITEEKSCINPETSYPLPTDIVNHEEKVAIEIQSWFHDFPDQKHKDEIKKNYWINKGYNFYAIDQRDYTVLQMVQLFFPYISDIPDYIDFDYSNKSDDVAIQRLLNEGKRPHEIAKVLKCNVHVVYDSIQYGRCNYPPNYIYACYHSVVQLDLYRNFVNRYDSIAEAKRVNGLKSISSCIHNKTYRCGNYYWVYESDYNKYLKGEFEIPISFKERFLNPIDQYDKNNNFIKHYDTIIDASKDNNLSCTDIERVANGKRKSAKGFIWKFAKS